MDRGKTCFIGRRLDCGRQLFNFSLSAVGRRLAASRKGRARCSGWNFATTKKSICLRVCGRIPRCGSMSNGTAPGGMLGANLRNSGADRFAAVVDLE